MKQGTANNQSGDQKREPIVEKINVGAVSQIGTVTNQSQSIHAGRGFTAPAPVATTQHNCGSQGKYK